MIFNPDKVSSIIDRKKPCSSCNFVECFFKDFPILDIIIPENGMKIKTKIVNLKLMPNITIIVNNMVRGSRTISSKIER